MATVHDALADLLEPLGDCMTPEVAEKVIKLRASAAANERIGLLVGKSAAGTLSYDEREEYEAYVSAGTFNAILQAKGREIIRRSGANGWTRGSGRSGRVFVHRNNGAYEVEFIAGDGQTVGVVTLKPEVRPRGSPEPEPSRSQPCAGAAVA